MVIKKGRETSDPYTFHFACTGLIHHTPHNLPLVHTSSPVQIDRLLPVHSYCCINCWNWRRRKSLTRLYCQCAEEPVGRGSAIGNALTVEPDAEPIVRTNTRHCVQLSCERGAISRHEYTRVFEREVSSDMTSPTPFERTQNLTYNHCIYYS